MHDLSLPQLRIARPVSDLERWLRMYCSGAGLAGFGRFADHDGCRVVLEHAAPPESVIV